MLKMARGPEQANMEVPTQGTSRMTLRRSQQSAASQANDRLRANCGQNTGSLIHCACTEKHTHNKLLYMYKYKQNVLDHKLTV